MSDSKAAKRLEFLILSEWFLLPAIVIHHD